jgi:hypothetical protein
MCTIFSGCEKTAVCVCVNVTHKKPYKKYEGKTNDVLTAFIGYVSDLYKLQQFKVCVQKSHHQLQCTFQPSWQ